MAAAELTPVDHALPDGWRRVRLGDVAEINRSNWDPAEGSSIQYLDLTAVVEPGKLSVPREITASEAPSRARRRVSPDDILVSTVRPNLRGFARVRDVPVNLVASTGFAVVSAKRDIHASFVYHHIMTPQFAGFLEAATTGQAYPAVRPQDVAAYSLHLPPLPEQRAIAAVLDSIDDAIEGAETVIAATEGLRDALLHDLLTRGLPGQHTEFRDVPGLGTIPADWEVVRLGNVVPKFEYGTSVKCSTEPVGMPILRIPNIACGDLNLTDLKYADLGPKESASVKLAAGDILLVRTNGNPDICGQCWVSEGLEGSWGFASYLVRGRADGSRINPWFAGHFLRSDAGRRLLKGNIRTSAGNYNLSVASLGSMPLPCPPLNEQDSIVNTIRALSQSIELAREESARLRLLKESTADALLTGQVQAT